LHHDSHILSAHSEYCETCGQRLPSAQDGFATWERKSKNNRIGIGISIALHLLGVLYYLFAPSPKPTHSAPPKGGQMVYIAPLPEKQVRSKPITKTKPEPVKTASKPPPPPRKQSAVKDTPAAPKPKLETYVPPVQATMTPPPEADMSEMIAKRRAARESLNPPAPPSPPVESEADRAKRIAMANIARANGAGQTSGADRDDTGGVFQVDKSLRSAEVKFRGWNTNFKRNWLQQIHVEQGAEQDIETAVVKEMIKIIRKEKQGDFQWESRRLGKVVNLSARKEDERELMAFLMKEMFPEYTQGSSR
jgi:type IV secretory pathway VirB10-like protein